MAYIYWLLGSGFYFYQFVFRTIFSTLGDEITQGLTISVADLSIFFSVGMLAYSLMQVPGGILIDRIGPRKILTIAMAMLGIGIILVGATESFLIALFGRVLMGAGSAFGFLGTSKIVAMWFSFRNMGFLLGITVFLGSMGGAFSKYFFEALPQDWSWRETLIGMGSAGLFFALALGLFLKEKETPIISDEKLSWFSGLKIVLSKRQILLPAFFAFFAYLPISVLADSWGILAFEKIFAVEKNTATQTIMYFYIAFSLGALFYCALSFLTKNPRLVLIIGFSLALFFLYVLIVHISLGKMLIAGIPGFLILTSLVGFNSGGISLCFPLGCSHAPQEFSGTVVGVMNMLCMVSGSIFSKLIGNILHLFWDGAKTADNFPVYSAEAFQIALQPLLITSLCALIFLWFSHESRS